MWLVLAFLSATLLGFYDVSKKQALRDNAVVPVLTLNTLFCSLIFLPMVVLSAVGLIEPTDLFYVPVCGWEAHKYVILKAVIVLSSWLCGYMAIKHLPLTIVGPINATRPVMVLLGAIMVFSERLNAYQWVGVLLAIASFYLLSRSGKREGIDFRHNRWIVMAVSASAFGAVSALYDKFLLAPQEAGGVGMHRMVVQSYFTFYQFIMMTCVLMVMEWRSTPKRSVSHKEAREKGLSLSSLFTLPMTLKSFHWHWAIPLISLFLSMADFAYFYALSLPAALISVVSMIRRGSVIVSFVVGALVFKEKNLRAKASDLALVLLSMLFLWLGSK